MAAKFFTGLPLTGPDPECVLGNGESLLSLLPESAMSPVPRPTIRDRVLSRRVTSLRSPASR